MGQFENYEPVLSNFVGGMHVCFLGEHISLDWMSPDLCAMVGYGQEELMEFLEGDYTRMVHPDDRQAFDDFAIRLSKGEMEETLLYRLIAKDGTVVPVSDTMNTKLMEDGNIWGFSVVTDLSNITNPFLDDVQNTASLAATSGLRLCRVRFTYGDNPQLIEVNDEALKTLCVQEDALAEGRKTAENLLSYASLPSLVNIALRCEREAEEGQVNGLVPAYGAFVQRTDGTYKKVSSWVMLEEADGQKVCTFNFVTNGFAPDNEIDQHSMRYLEFMLKGFDLVFKIAYESMTVTCVGNKLFDAKLLPVGIPMHFPSMMDIWLNSGICEEDREAVKRFVDVRNLPAYGETRELSFDIMSGGQRSRLDAMLVALAGSVALLCKRKESHDNGAVAAAPIRDLPGVYIRTFGHFDVFVEGEAIPFASEKAKEYLALLVDRRGGYVSTREAAMCLYEEESKSAFARCRKAAQYMNRALREAGIEDIVENNGSSRRLVTSKVRSDLFEYLAASAEEKQRLFNGAYLNKYSWGEVTKAELMFAQQ